MERIGNCQRSKIFIIRKASNKKKKVLRNKSQQIVGECARDRLEEIWIIWDTSPRVKMAEQLFPVSVLLDRYDFSTHSSSVLVLFAYLFCMMKVITLKY